jgi:hypothetical protein
MARTDNTTENTELSETIAAAQYVEQLLNSELQWLSNRISWLFVSQAFCLAAHAVVVTAQGVMLPLDFAILKWAMPIFGLISCTLVYCSVLAARKVAYKLADQRASLTARINRAMQLSIPRVGSSEEYRDHDLRWTRRAGGLPHHVLPLTLAVIWLLLLLARFANAA